MGKYFVDVTDEAKKHLALIHKSGDKSSISKVEKILEELSEHPETGTGKPERLKYSWIGYWSRRINKKDRLVYKIEDEVITVTVVSAIKHYGDK